jgi:hypothetical protein
MRRNAAAITAASTWTFGADVPTSALSTGLLEIPRQHFDGPNLKKYLAGGVGRLLSGRGFAVWLLGVAGAGCRGVG